MSDLYNPDLEGLEADDDSKLISEQAYILNIVYMTVDYVISSCYLLPTSVHMQPTINSLQQPAGRTGKHNSVVHIRYYTSNTPQTQCFC